MSGAYIVLSVNNYFDLEIEAHAGFEGAKKRALELANLKCSAHLDWIVQNPSEEKMDPIGSQWIFVNTSKTFIVVVYQPIQSPTYTKTLPSQAYVDADGAVIPINPVPRDNPEDPSLPGGWTKDFKPILMAEVINDPHNVLSYYNLTYNQKRALVLARLRRRPNFSMLITNFGTFLANAAIYEVQNDTMIGADIVAEEITWLENFRESIS
jgi:hypothetical protein